MPQRGLPRVSGCCKQPAMTPGSTTAECRGEPLHSAVVGSPGTVSRLQHPGLRGGSLCIVWGKIRFVRIDDLHRMKLL